jgi:hypothetical protein
VDKLEFNVVVVLTVGGDYGAHLQWPTNAAPHKQPKKWPTTHNEGKLAYLMVDVGVANEDTADLLHDVVPLYFKHVGSCANGETWPSCCNHGARS